MEFAVREFGITKIRLTGGEPTLRADFPKIVENLGRLRGSASRPDHDPLVFGMTTNGLLLHRHYHRLKTNGITKLNFSLDTLVPAQFAFISRRPETYFHRVVQNIDACIEDPAFEVKINCVVMNKFNHNEIADFLRRYCVDRNCEVRFIEFMPFDQNSWSRNKLFPRKEILEACRAFEPTLAPVEVGGVSGLRAHFGAGGGRRRVGPSSRLWRRWRYFWGRDNFLFGE